MSKELEQSLQDGAKLQLECDHMSLLPSLPSSAQQAEYEEIPDDGGVASLPHVFLHALNLHLKHKKVQTSFVPAVIIVQHSQSHL